MSSIPSPDRPTSRVRVAFLLAALLGGGASTASAQTCTPPERPAFDFQVDRPAVWVRDSLRPRPAERQSANVRTDPEALLVQVVVDTLGAPMLGTFKVLKTPSVAAADSVRGAAARWRFTPAMKGGCKVPQLVQTLVER